jgi:putative PIN family toxin of toxin-antitoxin system
VSEKPKVVIDTQLFLRAAINRRSLPAILVFDLSDTYRLVISPAIQAEITDVLNRPELRAKFSSLTDATVNDVMALLSAAEWNTPTTVPSISRDPKDNIFLACAHASGAQYIVSEDQDLLVLNPYEGTQILNASAFLNLLEAPSTEEE